MKNILVNGDDEITSEQNFQKSFKHLETAPKKVATCRFLQNVHDHTILTIHRRDIQFYQCCQDCVREKSNYLNSKYPNSSWNYTLPHHNSYRRLIAHIGLKVRRTTTKEIVGRNKNWIPSNRLQTDGDAQRAPQEGNSWRVIACICMHHHGTMQKK